MLHLLFILNNQQDVLLNNKGPHGNKTVPEGLEKHFEMCLSHGSFLTCRGFFKKYIEIIITYRCINQVPQCVRKDDLSGVYTSCQQLDFQSLKTSKGCKYK